MDLDGPVLVLTEAARFFGVRPDVIRYHADQEPIVTQGVPYNGNAKGLDFRNLCLLADAISKPRPTLKAVRDWKAVERQRTLLRIAATAMTA